jgi:hypothetical protein
VLPQKASKTYGKKYTYNGKPDTQVELSATTQKEGGSNVGAHQGLTTASLIASASKSSSG